jgi:hypothetical protein
VSLVHNDCAIRLSAKKEFVKDEFNLVTMNYDDVHYSNSREVGANLKETSFVEDL